MTPATLWSSWSWDPTTLLCLALLGLCYARGIARLWRRAGAGHGVRRWQAACFAGGLLALVVALVSPLDAMALALVSAHMVQHLLLILVAAPLLALGQPVLGLLWACPAPWRRAVGRWWRHSRWARPTWRALSAPIAVVALHTLALWSWHMPPLYQAAVQYDGIHALEHLCFLGTALLLWWTLIHPRRLGYGAGVLYVFATAMQSVALGVLLTFSASPWYPLYVGRTAAWGLGALADQQLAGVIMWVPAGVVYIITAIALFLAWMRAIDRGQRAQERTVHIVVPAMRERRASVERAAR